MSVLRIVAAGDQDDAVLYQPAARVRDFGPELHRLLDDMVETMRVAPGVGLAAPQIGVGRRIAVIEYPLDDEKPEETLTVFELINPEIIKTKGGEVAQEGCLSLPGLAADVERATYVLVRAQDRHGKEVRYKVYDWLARIFQHEIDHLHGFMMTDRATQLYRLQKNAEGEIEAIPIEPTLAPDAPKIPSKTPTV
ncbi:MAG: peptide deformylase [Caldilineaceae bacterium]|nr:peptide deformylase [Caldilineaceae bacterium]